MYDGYTVENNYLDIVPGQDFKIKVSILDQEGRLYVDENDAVVEIVFGEGQADLHPNSVISGQQAIAAQGVFSFNSLVIR